MAESKKIVVLGGTGFIGSAIVRGCSHDGLSCMSLGTRDCDLTDLESSMAHLAPLAGGSTVVYAAGIPRSRSDSAEALKTNLTMVTNMVAAFREGRPSRVILISSAEVYGIPVELPVNEQTVMTPVTQYGAGKVEAERILGEWCKEAGVPLAILRLPGVYGRADGGLSVVGKLVDCARSGRPFALKGTGSWRRDYVWVDDLARVVTALVNADFAELVLNVATGHSLSIREIIGRVSDLYGKVPVESLEETGDDGHLDFDVARFRDALPGLEMTGLDDGLKTYGNEENV